MGFTVALRSKGQKREVCYAKAIQWENGKGGVLRRERHRLMQRLLVGVESVARVGMGNTVGRNVQRFRATDMVRGKGLFSDDINVGNALTLKIVRSDRHHSRLRKVRVSKALEMPGVIGVLTAKEIPGDNLHGVVIKDQPLLAHEKVRFIGEPIAVVVAESEEAASRGVEAVEVEYEDLPPILDPRTALEPGSPLIHESGNLLVKRCIRKGDAGDGFAKSDLIVTRAYFTHRVEHVCLEPDAGVGYIDDNGVLVIHASTQNPHYDQSEVAKILGLPLGQIRVLQELTGGGFGSKLDLTVQGFIGLALYHFRRPVRLAFTREEVFVATSKRHPSEIELKTGVRKDGKLLALKGKMIFDTGPYASYGFPLAMRAAIHATGPYEIENVEIDSYSVYTNNPIAGAMRGVAIVQTTFAYESQMDILAEELGIDPLEMRKINALKPGSVTSTGQVLNQSVGILPALEAIEPFYQAAKSKWKREDLPIHRRRGVGLGAMWYGIGSMGVKNPSRANIQMDSEGRITLYSGAADIGQGSSTILCQIGREVLGLEPGMVRLVVGDTKQTPDAGPTCASRQTYISGNAVKNAAQNMADALLSEAEEVLKTSRSFLSLQEGFVLDIRDASRRIPLPSLAERMSGKGHPMEWEGYFDPETTSLDLDTGQGIPFGSYTYACHLALAEVDMQTGEVEVAKIVAAHDVGRAINPQQVEGQIHGGVGMGLGFTLMENYIEGTTSSLSEYHIPTSMDMPAIETIIVEVPDPTGPFGAKGMGEPALAPTPPAIINAVCNGLGKRVYHLPATSERIRMSCVDGKCEERKDP
jgi:nicotinate dehydrogenase large molybdopterin subunit